MLADGEQLVTLICPQPLLNMSRAVLRRCFARAPAAKKVLTLRFDRSSAASNQLPLVRQLVQRLNQARRKRSVVITTPAAIKSLMLKYIDLLFTVRQADFMLMVPASSLGPSRPVAEQAAAEVRRCAAVADCLGQVLLTWKRGVAVLDEVRALVPSSRVSSAHARCVVILCLRTSFARWNVQTKAPPSRLSTP